MGDKAIKAIDFDKYISKIEDPQVREWVKQGYEGYDPVKEKGYGKFYQFLSKAMELAEPTKAWHRRVGHLGKLLETPERYVGVGAPIMGRGGPGGYGLKRIVERAEKDPKVMKKLLEIYGPKGSKPVYRKVREYDLGMEGHFSRVARIKTAGKPGGAVVKAARTDPIRVQDQLSTFGVWGLQGEQKVLEKIGRGIWHKRGRLGPITPEKARTLGLRAWNQDPVLSRYTPEWFGQPLGGAVPGQPMQLFQRDVSDLMHRADELVQGAPVHRQRELVYNYIKGVRDFAKKLGEYGIDLSKDLHMGNIRMTASGRPMIIDVGLPEKATSAGSALQKTTKAVLEGRGLWRRGIGEFMDPTAFPDIKRVAEAVDEIAERVRRGEKIDWKNPNVLLPGPVPVVPPAHIAQAQATTPSLPAPPQLPAPRTRTTGPPMHPGETTQLTPTGKTPSHVNVRKWPNLAPPHEQVPTEKLKSFLEAAEGQKYHLSPIHGQRGWTDRINYLKKLIKSREGIKIKTAPGTKTRYGVEVKAPEISTPPTMPTEIARMHTADLVERAEDLHNMYPVGQRKLQYIMDELRQRQEAAKAVSGRTGEALTPIPKGAVDVEQVAAPRGTSPFADEMPSWLEGTSDFREIVKKAHKATPPPTPDLPIKPTSPKALAGKLEEILERYPEARQAGRTREPTPPLSQATVEERIKALRTIPPHVRGEDINKILKYLGVE